MGGLALHFAHRMQTCILVLSALLPQDGSMLLCAPSLDGDKTSVKALLETADTLSEPKIIDVPYEVRTCAP